jgi:hypothetical protein
MGWNGIWILNSGLDHPQWSPDQSRAGLARRWNTIVVVSRNSTEKLLFGPLVNCVPVIEQNSSRVNAIRVPTPVGKAEMIALQEVC